MKCSFNIATIQILITILYTYGMESPILDRFTFIKPRHAQYLNNNNQIIITGQSGCKIFHPITHNITFNISDNPCSILALHPNQKKIALYDNTNLTIYNIKTGKKKWSTKTPEPIKSITFNPLDTTLFLVSHAPDNSSGNIMKYNYKTNENHDPDHNEFLPVLSFHPVNKEMGIAGTGFIDFHAQDNFVSPVPTSYISSILTPRFCQYNNNGHFFATGNHVSLFITHLIKNSNPNCPWVIKTNYEYYKKIRFHPNNCIIAILATTFKKNYIIIRYADIIHQQEIAETQRLNTSIAHDFSFSSDGTTLIVTLDTECVILSVPFEVLYHTVTKKHALFIYLILKEYSATASKKEIPQDITKLLLYALLELYKR